MEEVNYYGFGPEENYIDRNKGALLGKYTYQVTDNLTPYLYPQECGNRTHVRELSVAGENTKLKIKGEDFEFSALHYTPYELENARHKDELPNVYQTVLCINEKQMVSILAVLVKFRNVCAHGERLFTYRTADSIPDLPIHRKLKITQKGSQYVNGKNDLFSVVIALRYMLNDQWYKEFIKELKALIDKYLKKHDSISEQELYEKMGFPENWRKITRYRKQ